VLNEPSSEQQSAGPRETSRQYAHPRASPLFAKAERLLDEHKLEITKSWLSRVIQGIEDFDTLESFPTQESIRASVEIIEGLAAALTDDAVALEFQPGGRYYEKAALLGMIGGTQPYAFQSLSHSLIAVESAIWDRLGAAFRREDRALLELVTRLRSCLHGVMTSSAESYCLRSSQELDVLAHTDPLTGLHNRRYLLQQLERHVELFKRYHHRFSLIMLDLDNLKWVNDTHGHVAGDAALKHLAMIMKVSVRDVDIPGRMGGDEFLVLMPETEKDVVEIVGRRIAEALAKTKLKVDSALVTLEVSAGQASCPEDGREVEELLQVVDASLYRSKQRKERPTAGR
jgi:diguanylate cyclase (GGDEF)-like protein